MLLQPVLGAPRRRLLSLVTAFTLALGALTGLIAVAPAADAAADPTITIAPNPAVPGALQTFTVTVTGGSDNNVAAADVTLPSGFSGIGSGTIVSSPPNWTLTFASPGTFHFTDANDSQGGQKLGDGQSAVFTFQAIAPAASGNVTFGLQTWSNRGRNGPGVSSTGTIAVGSLTQAITFGALGDKTYGDADFSVSATGGGSGNPVTFTASGDCTSGGTYGSTIHITGAGSCAVAADQAAGNGYSAASQVTRSFNIGKASQTITFDAIDTQTYGTGPLTLAATGGGSGNAVTYTTTGNCSVSGSTLTLGDVGTCTVKADQAGNSNYNAALQVERSFSITKATAILSLSDLTHDYDGNAHAATVTTAPPGLSGVTVTYDGSTTAPTAAGSYAVVATLDNANYEAESAIGTLVINAKHITGTFTVAGKTYDGNTDATVTGRDLVGVVGTDDVSLVGGTASFDSKDVGTRTATLTGATLSGADADNYVLDSVGTTTADITALSVTGAIVADDKTYDGTTVATAAGKALAGKIGSDDVKVHVVSASFADKNVGPDKLVTATIELTGADAGDYVLTSTTATDTATIWAILLTGSFTAANKVYDGTATASVTPAALSGVLTGEDVSLTATGATFSDKNVGTAKTVTATLGLTGADAGNYALTSTTGTALANITAKPVTASFTAANKVWDGTTAATISGTSLNGAISGDDVSIAGGTATFASPNVGTWTVTATGFTLTGADATNYALAAGPWTTTATISALYRGTGFYQPVDMPNPAIVWNTIKGGQTVPLKFNIYNAQTGVSQTALTIFGADATAQAKAFSVQSVACQGANALADAIEIVTTGSTSLRYDTTGGQYIQNWKTPTTVNSCWAVWVTTIDGSKVGPAYFKITK